MDNPEIMTEKEDMCAPLFFNQEELKHLNLAMTSYKKVVDTMMRGQDENVRAHLFEVCDNILAELANGNGKLG